MLQDAALTWYPSRTSRWTSVSRSFRSASKGRFRPRRSKRSSGRCSSSNGLARQAWATFATSAFRRMASHQSASSTTSACSTRQARALVRRRESTRRPSLAESRSIRSSSRIFDRRIGCVRGRARLSRRERGGTEVEFRNPSVTLRAETMAARDGRLHRFGWYTLGALRPDHGLQFVARFDSWDQRSHARNAVVDAFERQARRRRELSDRWHRREDRVQHRSTDFPERELADRRNVRSDRLSGALVAAAVRGARETVTHREPGFGLGKSLYDDDVAAGIVQRVQ